MSLLSSSNVEAGAVPAMLGAGIDHRTGAGVEAGAGTADAYGGGGFDAIRIQDRIQDHSITLENRIMQNYNKRNTTEDDKDKEPIATTTAFVDYQPCPSANSPAEGQGSMTVRDAPPPGKPLDHHASYFFNTHLLKFS